MPDGEVPSAERRFEALVTATAQMVWTADPSGQVQEDSPSWRAFTGQTYEEYRGAGWLDAVHENDRARVRSAWFAAVEARSSYEVEYRTRRHDGVYRWSVARGTPVLDASGRIVEWVGCNWDIHPIREAEAELARVVEFQEMLLAIVGHDLRTPLGTLAVGAAALTSTAESASVRLTAERMTRAVTRANEICGILLDLAEYKLGHGLQLRRELVDVAPLAEDVIAERRMLTDDRAVTFEPTGDTSAWVDRARLGQLFANLVGNAFDHGTPGFPIRVTLRGDDGELHFAVENAGEEIPLARAESLFAPFSGASRPPSKRRNLGLGLSIVKLIAEAHGGAVGVESSAGRVVFRVRLPRGNRAEAPP